MSDNARKVYEGLLRQASEIEPLEIRRFLEERLSSVAEWSCDLPNDLNDIAAWITLNASKVAARYAEYLNHRRAGGARRFFDNKAHALHFLKHVAPSKLVDGAWLYSTIKHADDWRYHALIRTYLEELGDGDAALNHVVLYRRLLAEHDCAPTEVLDDELYVQGALQLALGHMGDDFLPEMLGYNLGYEQLPLHLLITAFELNELEIDPYYFTLHITIDNASTGHASKAARSVLDLLPTSGGDIAFKERLRAGFLLNELGASSTAIIEAFDLEEEVTNMLEKKRVFGQSMHSDYCRLEGKTVNEWLASPGQSRQFLNALKSSSWIKQHANPRQSRFWQLIDGPRAAMFGVFNGYERQLLWDWIAGNWQDSSTVDPFRARFRSRAKSTAPLILQKPACIEPFHKLIAQLSPSRHSTPEGLEATRFYAHQLTQRSLT